MQGIGIIGLEQLVMHTKIPIHKLKLESQAHTFYRQFHPSKVKYSHKASKISCASNIWFRTLPKTPIETSKNTTSLESLTLPLMPRTRAKLPQLVSLFTCFVSYIETRFVFVLFVGYKLFNAQSFFFQTNINQSLLTNHITYQAIWNFLLPNL